MKDYGNNIHSSSFRTICRTAKGNDLLKTPCEPFSSSVEHIKMRNGNWLDTRVTEALKKSGSSLQTRKFI